MGLAKVRIKVVHREKELAEVLLEQDCSLLAEG